MKRIVLHQTNIDLLPEKALYFPDYQILVVSDWHIGKLGHFRKEGLFIPNVAVNQELSRLGVLIQQTQCKKVVFLGDLFHAQYNREWDDLVHYLFQYQNIEFVLTTGNHDIIGKSYLEASPIKGVPYLELPFNIFLSHEPLVKLDAGILQIVGHIHPGYQIKGQGRQKYKLPCFVLDQQVLTLPAFGTWTGLYMVEKTNTNQLFVILNDSIITI